MRIGLDIDNVITDYDKKLLEEYDKEDKNKRNAGIINPKGDWIRDCFDWSAEEVDEFYHKNMQEFAKEFEPREGAKHYMEQLLEDGHSLYLISHRVYPHYTEPYQITVDWLERYEIPYTKLILSETTDKSKECRENNIDIMFDDVQSNCHKLMKNGINCCLVETKYNVNNREGLQVVRNWKEIYEEIKKRNVRKKVILDTDMYNEIDDQFALTYLMKSLDVFDVEAITIAPFLKGLFHNTIEEGMQKSYETTLKLLELLDKQEFKQKVYKGATQFLKDSEEINEAVERIVEIANKNENTIIFAIGAITNVALAIKKAPEIISKIKVIWLGGNSFLSKDNQEFNFRQDIKAVQTVFDSGVELVVVPCKNVASHMALSTYEMKEYLKEATALNQYFLSIFEECKKVCMVKSQDKNKIGFSKIIWDITTIAYEIQADWFETEWISCPTILEDGHYQKTTDKHKVLFVNYIERNKIFHDFFSKMGAKTE